MCVFQRCVTVSDVRLHERKKHGHAAKLAVLASYCELNPCVWHFDKEHSQQTGRLFIQELHTDLVDLLELLKDVSLLRRFRPDEAA